MDRYELLYGLARITIAFGLAIPIGWNREHAARSAGLRTFPLVAAGSCAYVLMAMQSFDSQDAQARIIYGILTGIGFIGGGAILKHEGTVSGTATAASIWNTGAIGVAVGMERYEIAVILTVINVLTLVVGHWLKAKMEATGKHAESDF